jgi:hypothetical protein
MEERSQRMDRPVNLDDEEMEDHPLEIEGNLE